MTQEAYLQCSDSRLSSHEQRKLLYRYYKEFIKTYANHLNVYGLARKLICLYDHEQFVMSNTGLLVIDEVHNIPPVVLQLLKHVFSDIDCRLSLKTVLMGDHLQIHHPQYMRIDTQLRHIYGDIRLYELSENWRLSQSLFEGFFKLISLDNFAFGHRGELKYASQPVCMQTETGRICHTIDTLNMDLLTQWLNTNPDSAYISTDLNLNKRLKDNGCIHVYLPEECQGLTFKQVILGENFSFLNERQHADCLSAFEEVWSARVSLNSSQYTHYQRPTHELSLELTHRYAFRKLATAMSRATQTVIFQTAQPFFATQVMPVEHGLESNSSPKLWLASALKCLQQGYLSPVIEILASDVLWRNAACVSSAREWLNRLFDKKSEEMKFRELQTILSDQSLHQLFNGPVISAEQCLQWLQAKHAPQLPQLYANSASFFSGEAQAAVSGPTRQPEQPPKNTLETNTQQCLAPVPEQQKAVSNSELKLKTYLESLWQLLTEKKPNINIQGLLTHSRVNELIFGLTMKNTKTFWQNLCNVNATIEYYHFIFLIFSAKDRVDRFLQVIRKATQELQDKSLQLNHEESQILKDNLRNCTLQLSEDIEIKDLDKPEVLIALYNASKTFGYGYLDLKSDQPLTRSEAEILIRSSQNGFFDYIQGRFLKIDLSHDVMNISRYDGQFGFGAAFRAILKRKLERHSPALPSNPGNIPQDNLSVFHPALASTFKNKNSEPASLKLG